MKRLFLILFVLCCLVALFCITGVGRIAEEEVEYQGYVTLWFDDGLLSTYEIAYPILEEKGWKGTLAVVADRETAQEKFIPDGDPVMSWEQTKELANAGWEISSHSMTHPQLNSITDQAILESEIVDSKNRLEEIGFIVESFTFPYGQNGKDAGQSFISESYPYWRSSTPGINPLPAWRHITAEFLTTEINQQDVKKWIQEAEESQGWLVVCFHAIVDSPVNEWQHTKKQFSMVIEEIEQSNLKVVLPYEIYEKFGYAEDKLSSQNSNFQTALISIGFDGGYENIHTYKGLFAERNLKATWYINTYEVNQEGYICWDRARKVATLGWEIGNHSHTHPDFREITKQEKIEEVEISQNILKAELDVTPIVYAHPYGVYDEETLYVLRHYFQGVRSVGNIGDSWSGWGETISQPKDMFNYAPLNQYKIKAWEIHNTDCVQSIKDAIYSLIEEGAFVELVFHDIIESGVPSKYEFLASDLAEILDFIKLKEEKGVLQCITTGEAFSNYLEGGEYCDES